MLLMKRVVADDLTRGFDPITRHPLPASCDVWGNEIQVPGHGAPIRRALEAKPWLAVSTRSGAIKVAVQRSGSTM